VERGRQVGADDLVPVGGLDLEERADQRPSGVVDQPVHAAEALDDLLDQPLRLPTVADVGGEVLRVRAQAPGAFHDFDRGVGRANVMDRHRRAFRGGLDRHLGADAATAARDEDHAIRE
jgi:hypothetical protein